MPNTVIALKKSNTSAAIPSSLEFGELAINYKDGRLFYKAGNGSIASFGTTGTSFGTINANNTLIIADSPGAVVSVVPGNNISIVGDAVNDRITVGLKDDVTVPGLLSITASSGDEGGEIRLANAVTNSLLAGPVNIDIFRNQLRFFVSGGDARGAFINLAATAAGVGTDLLATGSSAIDTVARTTANAAFDKANSALANTSGITFGGNLIVSQNLSADKIIATNNGLAENFRVGDDAWIGDYNVANSIKIKGQQNASIGYISFGMDDGTALGRAGTGNLTYGGSTVWHSGIDGAGSGLDADLLDGQQGSYYGIATDVTAAFNKANAAGLPITTTVDTINATRYLIFEDSISGTLTFANVSYGLTYNPSSNTIGAINLNANGNIFVGPSTTTAIQTFYRESGGSGVGYIQCGYANSATDLHLGNWAGNIGRIVIAGSGNIGIGTNLPTSRLHVNGNANIRSLGVGTDASGVLGEVRATVMRDSRGDVRDLPIVNQIVGYGISLNDAGEVVSTNTTIFVPNSVFFAGNAVSVFNNSSASITITQNSSVTMYLGGTATTGNRTLAQRGVATILCVAANTFVISGAGLT